MWQSTIGKNEHGKQIRKSGITPTRNEAQRRVTELSSARQNGQLALPRTMTLQQWLGEWLERRRRYIAPSTYEQYELRLRVYVPAALKALKLQDLKTSHLRDLDASWMDRPLKASMRSKIMSHLRSAFEDAIEEGILVTNPARNIQIKATVAEQQSRKSKALTMEALGTFLKAAEDHRLYPVFYCLFALGLRRGEALGLRWQDIDLETGEMQIVQQVKIESNKAVIGALKTLSSRRRLYAEQDLLDVLRHQQRQQQADKALCGSAWAASNLVFTTAIGTPLHPRNVNRSIALICLQGGIVPFSSHTGRHTNITQRLRSGQKLEVVAAIAGHASPDITLNIYREVMEDEKRASTFNLRDQLSPPAKAPG